jgi:hypothetical protein
VRRESDFQNIREIFPCRDVLVHVRLVGRRDANGWKLCDVEVKAVSFPAEDGQMLRCVIDADPELKAWAEAKAKEIPGLGDQWEALREDQFRKMGIA